MDKGSFVTKWRRLLELSAYLLNDESGKWVFNFTQCRPWRFLNQTFFILVHNSSDSYEAFINVLRKLSGKLPFCPWCYFEVLFSSL